MRRIQATRHLRRHAVACVALGVLALPACAGLQRLGDPTAAPPPSALSALPASHDAGASPVRPAELVHLDRVLEDKAPRLGDEQRELLLRAVLDAGDTYGVDPHLLLAVMQVESGFNPKARGPAGSVGLMQILPSSGRLMARELGIEWQGLETLYDPETNIRIGAAYLARMHAEFRDLELSLAAYNMGPGRVAQLLRSGRRPAGIYAGKVKRRMDDLTAATRYAAAETTPR